MKQSKYSHIKEEAYQGNMQLPELGLVFSTFGNLSVADRDLGVFAIKPSGVLYADLLPENMVVIDFDGKIIEGELRPSSDTKTHAVLYQRWPLINSVVHTHSLYATAWAQSLRNITIYGTTHADHAAVDIPCIPPMDDAAINNDYEYQTGLQIIDFFESAKLKYDEIGMALVGGHAPFTWGKTSKEALYNSAILENLAHMAYMTELINPNVSRLKDALVKKHYERKHGKNAYYGQ
jgi:L-ribulose-5-phosphate 4-epimerase